MDDIKNIPFTDSQLASSCDTRRPGFWLFEHDCTMHSQCMNLEDYALGFIEPGAAGLALACALGIRKGLAVHVTSCFFLKKPEKQTSFAEKQSLVVLGRREQEILKFLVPDIFAQLQGKYRRKKVSRFAVAFQSTDDMIEAPSDDCFIVDNIELIELMIKKILAGIPHSRLYTAENVSDENIMPKENCQLDDNDSLELSRADHLRPDIGRRKKPLDNEREKDEHGRERHIHPALNFRDISPQAIRPENIKEPYRAFRPPLKSIVFEIDAGKATEKFLKVFVRHEYCTVLVGEYMAICTERKNTTGGFDVTFLFEFFDPVHSKISDRIKCFDSDIQEVVRWIFSEEVSKREKVYREEHYGFSNRKMDAHYLPFGPIVHAAVDVHAESFSPSQGNGVGEALEMAVMMYEFYKGGRLNHHERYPLINMDNTAQEAIMDRRSDHMAQRVRALRTFCGSDFSVGRDRQKMKKFIASYGKELEIELNELRARARNMARKRIRFFNPNIESDEDAAEVERSDRAAPGDI